MAQTTHFDVPGFGGQMIHPGDAAYDEARKVFNGMIDRRPALIARCSTPQDVVAAVNLAREQSLPLSVYGGGHGVTGAAVCDAGVVVDLRGMKGIAVDSATKTVRAEAGLTWGEFDAATQEHVPELAHGGIGEHAFNVGLHQADRGGKQGRRAADDPDGRHGGRRHVVKHVVTDDHVDPRRDHGGGVNERAHRGRAFHRVGQPCVEGNLRGLADRADQETEGDGRGHFRRDLAGLGQHRGVIERLEIHEHEEDGQQKTGITDSVDHEGFGRRLGGRDLLIVVADQQVRAEPHAFPSDEQHDIVVPHVVLKKMVLFDVKRNSTI